MEAARHGNGPVASYAAYPTDVAYRPLAATELAADPAAPAGFHLGYRRWLDGLRGVAVLMVLVGHLGFITGGFLGVDIFFVLSGFLITSLLVEEWQARGAISLRRFYLRRALRLLPAFVVVLAVGCLYTRVFLSAQEAASYRKEMVVAGCYIANWPKLHGIGMPTLGHTWSLSVEEQFYLLWPVLLYCMLRSGLARRHMIGLGCAGILASASLRFVLHRLHRHTNPGDLGDVYRLYTGLDTRADALLVGCVVALLATANLLPKSRRFVLATGMASLVAVVALGYGALQTHWAKSSLYESHFTVIAVLIGSMLVRLLSAPSRLGSFILESAPLVGVGRISYALYLVHMPIVHWLRPAGLGWRYPTETLAVAGLSFAAAVFSYFCIERPFLRMKRRLHVVALAPTASRAYGQERSPTSRAAA